jgi:carbon-monoxide dehydrogenase medium subunit
MKAARFDYVRPDTLEAALAILAKHGSDAAILAGGQSLMPMMNLRMARPEVLIDINRIAELGAIQTTPQRLSIGALARHVEVLQSSAVRSQAPLLSLAMPYVAHAAIRNRGTLGGSLALADPAAEMPACMVCLDADIVLASQRGERIVTAREFFQGVYTTARAADEMVIRIDIRRAGPEWRFFFEEAAQRRGDFALAGLAFAARLRPERIDECRVVFCGVEPVPRRLSRTEAGLVGLNLADPTARAAAEATLLDEVEPMGDDVYPPAYRRRLAAALLKRALNSFTRQKDGNGHA